MSASPKDAPRWPPRRWIIMIAAVCLLQYLLVVWLSDHRQVDPEPVRHGPRFVLLMDTPMEHRLFAEFESLDPAVFALVHPHGFSGAIWSAPDTRKRAGSGPEEHSFWQDQSFALTQNVARLGERVPEISRRDSAPTLLAALKPGPDLKHLNLATPFVRTQSVARLRGNLLERPVVREPPLPVLAHTNLLTNTVVQMAVDPAGYPVIQRLLSSSGWRLADERALEVAQQYRFEPSNDDDPSRLTWGQLTVEWYPENPAALLLQASP